MKPYKIVIVEDEELIREELKTLLINAGYVVDCITNFAKTIDYIKSAFPDLILLDINLPEQDGYRPLQLYPQFFNNSDFIHYRTQHNNGRITGINTWRRRLHYKAL